MMYATDDFQSKKIPRLFVISSAFKYSLRVFYYMKHIRSTFEAQIEISKAKVEKVSIKFFLSIRHYPL